MFASKGTEATPALVTVMLPLGKLTSAGNATCTPLISNFVVLASVNCVNVDPSRPPPSARRESGELTYGERPRPIHYQIHSCELRASSPPHFPAVRAAKVEYMPVAKS